MQHAHTPRDLDPDLPFVYCVAEPPHTDPCDPVAHGGISFLQECTVCGQHRVVNSNAGHREYGRWFTPPASLLNRAESERHARSFLIGGSGMTIAEHVAGLLGNDGTCWQAEDRRSFNQLMVEYGASPTTRGHLVRYAFPDGSAIVAAEGGWDVEGSQPFSWAGAE